MSVSYFAGYDIVHIRCWQRGPTGRLYPTEKVRRPSRLGQLPGHGHCKALTGGLAQHARAVGLLPEASNEASAICNSSGPEIGRCRHRKSAYDAWLWDLTTKASAGSRPGVTRRTPTA